MRSNSTIPTALSVCFLVVNGIQPKTLQGVQIDFSSPEYRNQVCMEIRAHNLSQQLDALAWAVKNKAPLSFKLQHVTYELRSIHNGRPLYYRTLTQDAAISTGADLVRNRAPYDLNGEGFTIGIWDSAAPLKSHVEFQNLPDRIRAQDDLAASEHATSIASVIGASGVDVRATGMAPSVLIDTYNWNMDTSEMAARGASFPNEEGTLYVSNHSYGLALGWEQVGDDEWLWIPPITSKSGKYDEGFGQYGDDAVEFDQIARLAPYYLIFFAAGNDRNDNPESGSTIYTTRDGSRYYREPIPYNRDSIPGDGVINNGYYTIGPLGVAKNIVTVGAVTDAVLNGYRDVAQADMTPYSAWGPADDGRVKPDIVANGQTLYTASGPYNTSYQEVSGTSLACPNASGSAILLVQLYERLFPKKAMRSSTLKGLLVHTADDLGNSGPDYRFGWGLINIAAAVALLDDHASGNPRLVEARLSSSQMEETYQVNSDGALPLRITLCWTDPEGSPRNTHDDRRPNLVNDLDLRMVGPNGSTLFYPFILDPNQPSLPATTGDNRRDNIEQIVMPYPEPGLYQVTIAHKAALHENHQWYSLIASETIAQPDSSQSTPIPWTRQIGSTASEIGNSIATDGQGNLYVVGSTEGSLFADSLGRNDAFLVKFNAEGTLIWSRQWGTRERDSATSVAIDSLGSVYVGGTTEGYLESTQRKGDSDAFICKYSPDGDLIWRYQFEPDWTGNDALWGLTIDHSDNIIITGYTNSSIERKVQWTNDKCDILLAKLDGQANLIWVRQILPENIFNPEEGLSVTTNAMGDIYLSGKRSLDTFVAKYTDTGSCVWNKTYNIGSMSEGRGIVADNEGNAYITGFTWGSFANTQNWGESDIFIYKVDAEGTVLWAQQSGTTSRDGGNGIARDQQGHLYITGYVSGQLGTEAYGSQDLFLSKYDADGRLLNVQQHGSASVDEGCALSVDALGNVFVIGNTYGSIARPNVGLKDVVLYNLPVERE